MKSNEKSRISPFAEYRQAVKDGQERVDRLTESLRAQTEHWRLKRLVQAFTSLRSIDFVAAVTLVAEIGNFSRFAHPRALMGFLGLTPSEYSSGIPVTGNLSLKPAPVMRGA